MKSRTQLYTRNRHASRRQLDHATAHREAADLFLALDRMLVEVSMNIYNLKGRARRDMRAHHGRLHAALREHLSDLRRRSRG